MLEVRKDSHDLIQVAECCQERTDISGVPELMEQL